MTPWNVLFLFPGSYVVGYEQYKIVSVEAIVLQKSTLHILFFEKVYKAVEYLIYFWSYNFENFF